MNILIISKYYFQNNDARAIQTRRVISSLTIHTNNHYFLITQSGLNTEVETIDNLNIIPIKSASNKLIRFFNKYICDYYLVFSSRFIKKSFQISDFLISQNKINTVLTISTPFESHIIGRRVKLKYKNIKWIAYFSDIWPNRILPTIYNRSKYLDCIELRHCKKVLLHSDTIVTPNIYSVDFFNAIYNINYKVKIIPHCFENNNNIQNQQIKNSNYLCHVGTLSVERLSDNIIYALIELREEILSFHGMIQVGSFVPNKLLNNITIDQVIFSTKSHIDEKTSRVFLSLFSIGIIIEANMEVSPFLPSKIADNVFYCEKIVCITPHKSALRDLKKYDGIFVSDFEKDNIKNTIKDALYSNKKITPELRSIFDGQNIAAMYNTLF